MKFLIITSYDSEIVEAEDFEEACSMAYLHNGHNYNGLVAIIKIPNEQ